MSDKLDAFPDALAKKIVIKILYKFPKLKQA